MGFILFGASKGKRNSGYKKGLDKEEKGIYNFKFSREGSVRKVMKKGFCSSREKGEVAFIKRKLGTITFQLLTLKLRRF